MSVSLDKLGNIRGTEISENTGDVFPMDQRGFAEVGGLKNLHGHAGAQSKAYLGQLYKRLVSVRGSTIADRDMGRIRKAASIILQEEQIYGR